MKGNMQNMLYNMQNMQNSIHGQPRLGGFGMSNVNKIAAHQNCQWCQTTPNAFIYDWNVDHNDCLCSMYFICRLYVAYINHHDM